MGVVCAIAMVMGGVETGLVYGLRLARARGTGWPNTFMAVLAATLLAAGVGRHYWDIWTHRTVRGISFLFVGIDAAGDAFSLVSIGESLVPLAHEEGRTYEMLSLPGRIGCPGYGYLWH